MACRVSPVSFPAVCLQPVGELQYQASFDTIKGQWLDVFIPFSRYWGLLALGFAEPLSAGPNPEAALQLAQKRWF